LGLTFAGSKVDKANGHHAVLINMQFKLNTKLSVASPGVVRVGGW